jgi:hypothetical protein
MTVVAMDANTLAITTTMCTALSEKGVRLAQKMQVGPYDHSCRSTVTVSYRRLKLAQLLTQLGVFLTLDRESAAMSCSVRSTRPSPERVCQTLSAHLHFRNVLAVIEHVQMNIKT